MSESGFRKRDSGPYSHRQLRIFAGSGASSIISPTRPSSVGLLAAQALMSLCQCFRLPARLSSRVPELLPAGLERRRGKRIASTTNIREGLRGGRPSLEESDTASISRAFSSLPHGAV